MRGDRDRAQQLLYGGRRLQVGSVYGEELLPVAAACPWVGATADKRFVLVKSLDSKHHQVDSSLRAPLRITERAVNEFAAIEPVMVVKRFALQPNPRVAPD